MRVYFPNHTLKVKVKFALEQSMKAQRVIEVYSTRALTSALDSGGRSTLLSCLADLDRWRISDCHRILIPRTVLL
jgi:hypothetical protein